MLLYLTRRIRRNCETEFVQTASWLTMPSCFLLVSVFLLILGNFYLEILSKHSRNRRQTEDFNAGGLPSHLPSPPEPEVEVTVNPTQGQSQIPQNQDANNMVNNVVNNMVSGSGFYDYPSTESLTSAHVNETKNGNDAEEDDDADDDDGSSAPFGLDETILIIVPQFKYTIHGFPDWTGASVRLSLPITIFFDELDWPKPPTPNLSTGIGRYFLNGGWRRGGGSIATASRRTRSILSLPPPEWLRGGERATLIPKLERLVTGLGLGNGRDCLLRSVCEIHEAGVESSYGFLGQFLKQVFSIRNSLYAETHLASYTWAEDNGKEGNCSQYQTKCVSSLFY